MAIVLRMLAGYVALSLLLLQSASFAICPWEVPGLKKWSKASTWSKGVPQDNDEITLPSNTKVLLDEQPASLATLTIGPTSALIWSNVSGLVLNAHYIWVMGEFHMGSESCRLPGNATIRLHGTSNDKYSTKDHEFGRKFLGVAPGGVLELHGQEKTSWTKLAQTVRPIQQIPCASVYDHQDPKKNWARVFTPQLGLNIIIWNEDGSLMDFFAFKEKFYEKLTSYFTSVPDGKVVGLFTYGTQGVGKKKSEMIDLIRGLGGNLITSTIDNKDSYALVARKGFKETAKEYIEKDVKTKHDMMEIDVTTKIEFLALHDKSKKLVFQVAKDYWSMKRASMFRVLHEDAAFPTLTLADGVTGWKPGDEVLLTSTDFAWQQAEIRRIIDCSGCSKRQIKLNDSLTYLHYGNFTYGVDQRGEVAMMTRSILIEGVLEDECKERTAKEIDSKLCTKFKRDTFGGHLMAVRGFKTVHIEGVKLQRMGQQMHRGAYPLHFHMCDDVKGAYVRENTVFDSFSRCVAVHGTNYLEVKDNVCFMHLGHGIFLEDSVEQHNKIQGNLVAGTLHGHLLLSDMNKDFCPMDTQYCDALSSYWLTHPNNDVIGNVAAGGEGKGFMYVFADQPLGPSLQRQKELNRTHNPKASPLHFTDNDAHSNADTGVHMDEKISTGTGMENKGNITENGVLRCENEYHPHINGKPVWVDMARGNFYKNGNKNMWIKGGNVRITQCSLSDSKEGLTGGTTLFDTGTQAHKTIFIGESENLGCAKKRLFRGGERYMNRSYSGDPSDTLTAISIYQGPILIIDCFFDKYTTVDWCLDPSKELSNCPKNKMVTRHSGAISFKRASTYPAMTSSYTLNNTFGFCDNDDRRHWVYQGPDSLNDWDWKDGNTMVYVRDRDGKLTGTPNASIVPNYQLYSGDECQLRADWGNMLVCPYRYVKLEILGTGGNLDPKGKVDTPMFINRDDTKYNEPFSMTGQIRNEYLLRTGRSYMIEFNKKTKGAGFPSEIKLFGYGVEQGDEVRVGICQPRNVKYFEVLMEYPVYIKYNATWVDSLTALDEDKTGAAFFHDKTNGILFFKMMSFHKDNNETQRCPHGKCWRAVVRPKGHSSSAHRYCKTTVKPFIGKEEAKTKPTTPSCPGIGSPEGLGAVKWNEVKYIEHEEYSIPCSKTANPLAGSIHLGCFKEKLDKYRFQEMRTNEEACLYQTMTPEFCVNRCHFRGYKFAALARESRCTCGNVLQVSEGFNVTANNCNLKCKGDKDKSCGGDDEIDAWSTGR